ncbi:MAG: hypothetical protein LUM44_09980 [Pyrinomonadaceae bacterium]|nr:hypothetical protein [Pyrinomonadaceae bacterium]
MKFNLNDREKKRFAETFRNIADLANNCAKACESGEDATLMKDFLFLSIGHLRLQELRDIITGEIQNTAKANHVDVDFPDEIFPKG